MLLGGSLSYGVCFIFDYLRGRYLLCASDVLMVAIGLSWLFGVWEKGNN